MRRSAVFALTLVMLISGCGAAEERSASAACGTLALIEDLESPQEFDGQVDEGVALLEQFVAQIPEEFAGDAETFSGIVIPYVQGDSELDRSEPAFDAAVNRLQMFAFTSCQAESDHINWYF